MATPFQVQELRFTAESTFAENITSLGTNTYTTRIPVQGLPTITPMQERIDDAGMLNYVNDMRPGFAGPREATIEFTTYWCGYGATTASGALATTWQHTLLNKALGGSSIADSGSTVNTGTDADTFTTVANPADFTAGSILRVGSKGDGRADGDAAAVTSISSQTVELLTALSGTPNAADVVYASILAYPDSDGFTDSGGTTRTMRFIASNLDTGASWVFVGCQLEGLTATIAVGQIPTLTWRYRCAYWDRRTETMPSAVALSDDLAAPTSGGSVYFQTVGTTTRSEIDVESLSVNIDLGLIPHRTVGGSVPLQTITGYTRTHCRAELNFRLHTWATTYETLWDLDGSTATHKHILFQSNATDGRSVGFYCPRTYIKGPRPTREDVAGLTGVSFTMMAREGTTTTNDLTRSPIRFFFA